MSSNSCRLERSSFTVEKETFFFAIVATCLPVERSGDANWSHKAMPLPIQYLSDEIKVQRLEHSPACTVYDACVQGSQRLPVGILGPPSMTHRRSARSSLDHPTTRYPPTTTRAYPYSPLPIVCAL
jgi:hypothetical protein